MNVYLVVAILALVVLVAFLLTRKSEAYVDFTGCGSCACCHNQYLMSNSCGLNDPTTAGDLLKVLAAKQCTDNYTECKKRFAKCY